MFFLLSHYEMCAQHSSGKRVVHTLSLVIESSNLMQFWYTNIQLPTRSVLCLCHLWFEIIWGFWILSFWTVKLQLLNKLCVVFKFYLILEWVIHLVFCFRSIIKTKWRLLRGKSEFIGNYKKWITKWHLLRG